MARETGHRDSEIGGSKNGNNNALLESLVNGYGNGKYSLAYIVIMFNCMRYSWITVVLHPLLPVVPTYCRSGWIVYAHKWVQQRWRTVGYRTALKQFPQPSSHTSNTFSDKQSLPVIVLHCSQTNKAFFSPSSRELSIILQHNCALFCTVMIVTDIKVIRPFVLGWT